LESTIKTLTEQIVALKAIPPISRGEEWEERQKARQMEMQTFSKALAVLSSDDAHDLFKTKIKKVIDDMIIQLGKDKYEIKHEDFCIDEFNKNQLETEKKERERQDLRPGWRTWN